MVGPTVCMHPIDFHGNSCSRGMTIPFHRRSFFGPWHVWNTWTTTHQVGARWTTRRFALNGRVLGWWAQPTPSIHDFSPKEIAFARVLSSILPDSRKFADFHAIFLGESHASAWFSLPTLGKRLHSRKTLHCGDPSGNQKRKLDKHPCPSPTPAPQLLAESAIFFGQTWRRWQFRWRFHRSIRALKFRQSLNHLEVSWRDTMGYPKSFILIGFI